jgi:exonuclease III
VLYNVYMPNGGQGNKRVPFKLQWHQKFGELIRNQVESGMVCVR